MLFRLAILFLFISHSSVYAEDSQESIDSQNSHNYDDSEDAVSATAESATTTSPCNDLINCTLYKPYCSNPAYTKLLCVDCQKTCDFCGPIGQSVCAPYNPTSPPCIDVPNSGCSKYAQDCSNPVFRSTLCQDCRATCGFCGSRYNDECVGTCVDNTDCSGFLNLCKVASNKQMMCSQCKKSCGFCAPSTYCN